MVGCYPDFFPCCLTTSGWYGWAFSDFWCNKHFFRKTKLFQILPAASVQGELAGHPHLWCDFWLEIAQSNKIKHRISVPESQGHTCVLTPSGSHKEADNKKKQNTYCQQRLASSLHVFVFSVHEVSISLISF